MIDEGRVEVEVEGRVVAQHQRPGGAHPGQGGEAGQGGAVGREQRHCLGGRHREDEGVEGFIEKALLGGAQAPAVRAALDALDGALQPQVEREGQGASRGCHARGADKALQRLVRCVQVCRAEDLQPRLPDSRHAEGLPASHFGSEIRVAGGEILGAVVALPALATAGTHAAGCAAAFLEEAHFEALLLEVAGTGEAGKAGTDDCNALDFIHGGLDNLID